MDGNHVYLWLGGENLWRNGVGSGQLHGGILFSIYIMTALKYLRVYFYNKMIV